MRKFLRILLIFVYFCLSFFITSNEVQACSSLGLNNQVLNFVNQPKSEIIFINKSKEIYFISNTPSRYEVAKNNKNSNIGHLLAYKPLLENDILNDNILNKNIIVTNHISHNISQNLKNVIYTRAP